MTHKTHSSDVKRSKGEKLLEKVNELAREGHGRHISIKDRHERTVLSFPLTFGVAAAVIAPILVCIGVIIFFVTESTLVIKRKTHTV
jgi:hypothetical protein